MSFPRNADDLILCILSAIKTLPKENSIAFVMVSLEIASSFKRTLEAGWQNVFESLLHVFLNTPSDLPFQIISTQFVEHWRGPFLSHVEFLKKHVEKLKAFFLGSSPLERVDHFNNTASLDHHLSICSSLFFSVVGSASSLLKDSSRKHMKTAVFELVQVLIDSIVLFQSFSGVFDVFKNGMTLATACKLGGMKNCTHFETVGLLDIQNV